MDFNNLLQRTLRLPSFDCNSAEENSLNLTKKKKERKKRLDASLETNPEKLRPKTEGNI